MAIIVDKDGNVITVENEPEEARAMFPNTRDFGVGDVLVNGTSIVDENGDADIALKTNGGLRLVENELATDCASTGEIKTGTNAYKPVVPAQAAAATFYGLSKAAGANLADQTAPLGSYTDNAKIAIQKMLGVYEAPWELIREDTFTNATEADIEITADDNGQSFELTDIRLVFSTPQQETQATVGSYGRCRAYFGDTVNDIVYLGAYTQNANGGAKTGMFAIEQRNSMILRYALKTIGNNADVNIVGRNNYDVSGNTHNSLWEPVAQQRIYNKIVIEAVTGTATVKVYGKRKWQ